MRVQVLLAVLAFPLGFCGCAQNPTIRSNPYSMVDTYSAYLSVQQRERFWSAAQERGLKDALSNAKLPFFVLVGELRVAGSYYSTPLGYLSEDEYRKHRKRAAALTADIRRIASGI